MASLTVLRRYAGYFLMVVIASSSGAWGSPPEPAEYRLEHYRSPTPATLAGAETVQTARARSLIESGTVAVDTTPVTRTGFTDMTGQWNVVNERLNIPGSLWLPNIGYGALDLEMQDYMRRELDRALRRQPGRGLLFYCYADCWMSWNAAKRALNFGYGPVYWYPDGTDGWAAAGLPLEKGDPRPLFEED